MKGERMTAYENASKLIESKAAVEIYIQDNLPTIRIRMFEDGAGREKGVWMPIHPRDPRTIGEIMDWLVVSFVAIVEAD